MIRNYPNLEEMILRGNNLTNLLKSIKEIRNMPVPTEFVTFVDGSGKEKLAVVFEVNNDDKTASVFVFEDGLSYVNVSCDTEHNVKNVVKIIQ